MQSPAAWWDDGTIQQKQQQQHHHESRVYTVQRWDLNDVCSHAQRNPHNHVWAHEKAWLWLLSWTVPPEHGNASRRKTTASRLTWPMVCRLLLGRTCQGYLFWLAGFLRCRQTAPWFRWNPDETRLLQGRLDALFGMRVRWLLYSYVLKINHAKRGNTSLIWRLHFRAT